MTEAPRPNDAKTAFLAGHEQEIKGFLSVVHGQLDHATESRKNDGNLWKPVRDANLLACKWQTTPPVLPDHLSNLVPFAAEIPVSINARYRYGLWQSMVNIWITNPTDQNNNLSIGLRIDPETGEVTNTDHTASVNHGKEFPLGETDTRAIVDGIFAHNSTYTNSAPGLQIADAFKLGIISQPEFGGELYTVEVAEKQLGSQERRNAGQFSLEVRAIDRTHPNGKPSSTYIALRRQFAPEDYAPDGLYSGVLVQGLVINQDKNGGISDITRNSSVHFYDEPALMETNRGFHPVSMLNKAEADIPEALAEKLYLDETPELHDLEFFNRLITQPIEAEDLYIK